MQETGVINGHSTKKYNIYDLTGDYGIGYTTKDEKFYFDLEDYDLIKNYYWYINKGYVESKITIKRGRTTIVQMHRLVMNIIDNSMEVDHILHKTYDNRKSQLRTTTHSQNNMNKGIQSNNTSGITGVHYDKVNDKWVASITKNRKYIFLGRYINIQDAIVARKTGEEKYFKEYSYYNSMKKGDNNDQSNEATN